MEIVISVPLSAKKFTQKDLNLSQQYISTHLYPGLYKEEDLPKGMKFVDRRIMDIEDISLDNPSQKDVDSTNATNFTFQTLNPISFINLLGSSPLTLITGLKSTAQSAKKLVHILICLSFKN